MPPRARPNFKSQRRPTFIRAWRKHRDDMSQEKFVERLLIETEYEMSTGQLSRIERGEQPYSQDFLEAAATVLRCAPEDLIMRDPTRNGAPWSILDGLNDDQMRQVTRFVRAIRDEDDDVRKAG